MREILFKAKCIDTGKWIEGLLGKFPELIGGQKWDIQDSKLNFTEIDPSTVCQFTGLLDSKGVKIFEGDISDTGRVVRYVDASFYLTIMDTGSIDSNVYQDITVTSNIHNKDSK